MTQLIESVNSLARAPRDGLSHVAGDANAPLWPVTISGALNKSVSRFGSREAVICIDQGIRRTYAEFALDVDVLASGLLELDLEKGDRVGIWSPNCYEWLLTQFATARIGCILVNINPAYQLTEIEYAVNKVGCKVLITADCFKASDYIGMLRTLAPELEHCDPGRLKAVRLPTLRTIVQLGRTTETGLQSFEQVWQFGAQSQLQRLDAISDSLKPDDPVNIQFTSGTTGAPKGATLTHSNIVNNARFVTRALNFTEFDKLCIPVPLYHCFGMVMGTLGCVTKGAAMVLPGEAFEPEATLSALASERCTAVYGVPTMFVTMLDSESFGDFDLSALRTGIMAGAPCPIEIMKRVYDDMNLREITIAYGMTETSPVSFQSSVDDPIEKRVSTVGRIHPHVEVKIADEQGNALPVGQQGEVWTRGYSVMQGYWNDDERTEESIVEGGWMRTGDLARIDKDGYCTIVGRVKDMIIRGGENIFPREIEEFLYQLPGVQEAQVFGIPNRRYGEEVCAWIVPGPGSCLAEEEIRASCRGQIAHFKIPKHIRFVDALPMTVTGKPQKFVMRERMIEEMKHDPSG